MKKNKENENKLKKTSSIIALSIVTLFIFVFGFGYIWNVQKNVGKKTNQESADEYSKPVKYTLSGLGSTTLWVQRSWERLR